MRKCQALPYPRCESGGGVVVLAASFPLLDCGVVHVDGRARSRKVLQVKVVFPARPQDDEVVTAYCSSHLTTSWIGPNPFLSCPMLHA